MKRARQESVKYRDRDVSATVVQPRGAKLPGEGQVRQVVKLPKANSLATDWVPPSVTLSTRDMAQNIVLIENNMAVLGEEVS